jgi:hypothetical protein
MSNGSVRYGVREPLARGECGWLPRGRRGFPGPVSCPHLTPFTSVPSERNTPVPTPAHHSPRAIRVRRSPR